MPVLESTASGAGAGAGAAGTPGLGHLAPADDPMAVIEVVDGSGSPMIDATGHPLMGLSPLDCPDLKPGRYRARLKTPEGPVGERMVQAEAGRVVPVELTVPPRPPAGLTLALVDRFRSLAGDDFEKRVSAIPQPTLMSVLALADEALQRSRSRPCSDKLDPSEAGLESRPSPPDEPTLVGATLKLGGQGIVVVLAAEMAPPSPPDEVGQAGPAIGHVVKGMLDEDRRPDRGRPGRACHRGAARLTREGRGVSPVDHGPLRPVRSALGRGGAPR